MTDAELAHLRELTEKATPGPWRWDDDLMYGANDFDPPIIQTDSHVYGPKEDDAAFIAAARTAIPALIAEVERLRAELDAARSAK